YHRDNAELIFKMLDRLLTEETTIEQFSENLGILIHFFCDYTCIYHANDHLYENHSILKHMKYEVMLHRYAAKKFLTLETVRMIPFKSVDEIKDYVCDLTSRLNQVPLTRSVAQDFDDMMLLSVSVLQYIMNQYEFHKLLISHDKR
ncbi:MAG: zinc dependent phospholipase C family protein, partial [Bacillota bacterium]|nr:zinc dependent phospholipase C family protein [Bacillota bacterium]